MSLLGVGPEMKKFDQVSDDHHQMSLAAGGYVQGVYPEGSDCRYVQRGYVYVQGWVRPGDWVCLCGGYVQG